MLKKNKQITWLHTNYLNDLKRFVAKKKNYQNKN